MKKMIFSILVAAAVQWAVPVASAQVKGPKGHCGAQEVVVLSCTVGKRVVSVCGVPGKSLQYRYGPAGAVELSFPADPTTFKSVANFGRVDFASGGAGYVRFVNKNVEYVVFTASGTGWEKDGLIAVQGGKVVNSKVCDKYATGTVFDAEAFGLPKDSEEKAVKVWDLVPMDDTIS